MSTFEDILSRVDRFPERVPLHRLNACTTYKRVEATVPFAVIASECTNHVFKQDLFYLFLTVDEGWVQVSLEMGQVLLQHLL